MWLLFTDETLCFFHTCVHSQQQSQAQLPLNNAELWRHTPDADQP